MALSENHKTTDKLEVRVPFYNLLCDYSWIFSYQRNLEIREEIASLQAKVLCINNDTQKIGNSLSQKCREALKKRLDELGRRITQLEVEKAELSPVCYFVFKNGRVAFDIRTVFIKHWRDVQKSCSCPCGPSGMALERCSDDERLAYRMFKIYAYINRSFYEQH